MRKGNRRCPFLFAPAAGAATSPPSAERNSPLRFSEKLPPVRGEPPAQFACPGQPVLKNPRPLGANPLTQFEYPAQPVQKRSRPSGANRLYGSGASLDRCRITGEICDTTLFYYKMHPLLRQAQPPGEA